MPLALYQLNQCFFFFIEIESKKNIFIFPTSYWCAQTNFVANWMMSEQFSFSIIFGPAAMPSNWQANSILVVQCFSNVPQTEPSLYKRYGASFRSSDNCSSLFIMPIDKDCPFLSPVTWHDPASPLHGSFGSVHTPNTYFLSPCWTLYCLPDNSFKS